MTSQLLASNNPPPLFQRLRTVSEEHANLKFVSSQLEALRSKPHYKPCNFYVQRGEKIGVSLQEWKDSACTSVRVTNVEPTSSTGLCPGDRIIAINENLITSRDQATHFLSCTGNVVVEVLKDPYVTLSEDNVVPLLEDDSIVSLADTLDSVDFTDQEQLMPSTSDVIPELDLQSAFPVASIVPPPPPPEPHIQDLLQGKFLKQLNFRPPASSYICDCSESPYLDQQCSSGLTLFGWLRPGGVSNNNTATSCVIGLGKFMRVYIERMMLCVKIRKTSSPIISSSALLANEWCSFVVRFDRARRTVHIYLDNKIVGTALWSNLLHKKVRMDSSKVIIGDHIKPHIYETGFAGSTAGLQLFSSLLSQEEVHDMLQRSDPRNRTPPLYVDVKGMKRLNPNRKRKWSFWI